MSKYGVRYDEIFKKDAVDKYFKHKNYSKVAREIGVSLDAIREWVKSGKYNKESNTIHTQYVYMKRSKYEELKHKADILDSMEEVI